VINVPEDLSLGGFQVVAYGAPQCPTSADQCSFKVGGGTSGGVLETTGFKTTNCGTTNGCCIQANSSSLAMAACDPASTVQQFDVEDLSGKPGQIKEKATGLCLAIKVRTAARDCPNPQSDRQLHLIIIGLRARDSHTEQAGSNMRGRGNGEGAGGQRVAGRHGDQAEHGRLRGECLGGRAVGGVGGAERRRWHRLQQTATGPGMDFVRLDLGLEGAIWGLSIVSTPIFGMPPPSTRKLSSAKRRQQQQ
jgi:hypothetical protein